ncbi:hypothetical protein K9N68_37425 (plasmid) [Kovacikia minuta CCNUW1]|uniref:hypothetical protein n=1 Tax=Kovacikia minuta TaxID=2931930 RepID=UPI001CCBBD4F|nr:hypothetical protein [Kovacikia minuta]UBF29895.1 hypothetical protein K9N68_37425 [Kovacikia minuta CCNUW1]
MQPSIKPVKLKRPNIPLLIASAGLFGLLVGICNYARDREAANPFLIGLVAGLGGGGIALGLQYSYWGGNGYKEYSEVDLFLNEPVLSNNPFPPKPPFQASPQIQTAKEESNPFQLETEIRESPIAVKPAESFIPEFSPLESSVLETPTLEAPVSETFLESPLVSESDLEVDTSRFIFR